MRRYNKYNYIYLIIIVIGNLCVLDCYAQIKTIGIPPIRNYHKSIYNARAQNWSVTQDSRGIMYFGNNNGVLEFDGNSWRTYPIPNMSIARCVYKSSNGLLYVGAFNEFGYLFPNKKGEMQYRSLITKLPEKKREVYEIWKIHETNMGIVFQSFTSLLIYDDSIKTIINSDDQIIDYSFYVNDKLLVGHRTKGLIEITNDGYKSIKNGDFFIGKPIVTILPFKNDQLLIGTDTDGFYVYNNGIIHNWFNTVNNAIIDKQLYCGITIGDNYIALGTIQGGLYIFDIKGNLIQHLYKGNGLQNNSVLSIFYDGSQNLWLGLDDGIDYIKINSPATYINVPGEIGAGYISCLYKNYLYLGTNHGVYYTYWGDSDISGHFHPKFTLMENTIGQVWNLQNIDDKLICGHHDGTFVIEGNNSYQISDIQGGWKYLKIPDNPDYMISGSYTGLLLFKKNTINEESNWEFVTRIKGFNESSRWLEIDNKGIIWVSHDYKGIYRLKLNNSLDSIIQYAYYNENNGLPSNYMNSIFNINGRVYVSSLNGNYELNKQNNAFVECSTINNVISTDKVDKFCQDENNNIWFFQNNELGQLRISFDGSYAAEKIPFSELKGNYVIGYESIIPISHNQYIISNEDGFIHFDLSLIKNLNDELSVLIRQVISREEVLFGGTFLNENNNISSYRPVLQNNVLSYKYNNIRFESSANFYESTNKIQYRYWLEGYDNIWSEWSLDRVKEYTLTEGNYTFHVQAKNEFNIESEVSTYKFSILPPVYRSLSAKIIYVLLILLIIFITIKLIFRKIEKEKNILKKKQKEEFEKKQKEFENEAILAEQEIVKLRNEKLRFENERNIAELENKSKELAAILMQISTKNDTLNKIKNNLVKVSHKMIHAESKEQVINLVNTIEKEMDHEDDWKKFENYFDQVHEDFIHKLRDNYPELTPKDLKLAAYLRMNLSTKEIATLLNITLRGIETSRYRLRKKLHLEREHNLTDFLLNI